jgi:dTDP-4-amino-4,6-dideoxygalactose transaminase
VSDPAIPLLDLAAQNAPLHAQIHEALERVIRSNAFILGAEVDALERELANALGIPHSIGVSSGTDALLLAMMALGIGPGDEIITTPYSFFATAGCIARLHATPVFVDIDPRTFNLDLEKARGAIGSKTKAILPVHLFGQPCDPRGLIALWREFEIPIIEDAAQAIGAVSECGPIGGIGAIGCFSFFPSKNLGAFGDAGLCTTRDEALAHTMRRLRSHGAEPKYFHQLIGGNFRLDALQAAVLRVKLPHLNAWTEERRVNAANYDRLFREAQLPPAVLETPARIELGHIYNQYVIRTPHRDALKEHLRDRNIGSEIYYPRPLHLQECFAYLGYTAGDFPEAEKAARETLALPIFPELGKERLERVANTVIEFLRRFG